MKIGFCLSRRMLLILLIGAGCATRPALTPLVDSTTRYEGMGFSVLPPQGNGWYVSFANEYGVSFIRSLHESDLDDRGLRSLALSMLVMNPEHLTSIEKPGEFVVALEGLMTRGLSGGRFRLVDFEIRPFGGDRDFCGDYNYSQQETANPSAPGVVLEIRVHGFICLDQSAEFLVNAQISERRPEGEPSRLPQWMEIAGEDFLRNAVVKPKRRES